MPYHNLSYQVSSKRHIFSHRMSPYQRLEKIAQAENRKPTQIVEMANRHPSIVSAIRNGKKGFSDELADAIAARWGYSRDWILTGEGDMKLVIAPTGIGKTDFLQKAIRIPDRAELLPILKTPLYARAGMGYTAYFNRPPEEQEWDFVPENKLYPGVDPESHTIVTVNGDSMEPTLLAGWEMLAYKLPEGAFPRLDKIVMIDYKDELIIKRLTKVDWQDNFIVLQSDNGNQNFEIPMDEIRAIYHVYNVHNALI